MVLGLWLEEVEFRISGFGLRIEIQGLRILSFGLKDLLWIFFAWNQRMRADTELKLCYQVDILCPWYTSVDLKDRNASSKTER